MDTNVMPYLHLVVDICNYHYSTSCVCALRGHIDIHKVNTGIAAFSDVACW